jgi:hypothetical protein
MTTPAEPRFILYPPGWQDTDIIANVDWATGSLQWFITLDDYQDLMDTVVNPERDFDEGHGDLVEIWVHELEHLLQFAVTGFAYDLSYRMYEIVDEAAQRYASLEQIYRHRNEYADRLVHVLEALDRAGSDGVTPRHLLEGLAFLRQKRLFAPDLTHATFLEALNAEVEYAPYRNAYDLTTEYLGDDAIVHFAHIANLALYTRQPEVVFVPLLERFAARASRLGRAANHQLGTDLLGDRFPALILGPAVSQARTGRIHPAVSRAVARIEAWTRAGFMENRFFNLHAGFAPQEALALATTMMYFPPDELGKTPLIAHPDDPAIEADGKRTSWFRYLCAVSRILQEDLPDPEILPAMSRPRPPSDTQTDLPLSIKVLYFSHEAVTLPEKLDQWADNLMALSANPATARSFRGTCVLTFGDLDGGWQPEFTDPQVGAFVRGLFERIPHLLYFLYEGTKVDTTMAIILGAFAPEDKVRLPDGRLGFRTSSRTMSVVTQLLREAADFAERIGEPRSIVLAHLETLPPQIGHHIREIVSG